MDNIEDIQNDLQCYLDNIEVNTEIYDKSKYTRVRAYLMKETDNAILIRGKHFKAKWIPKKYVIKLSDSKIESMLGDTYAWLIERWILK